MVTPRQRFRPQKRAFRLLLSLALLMLGFLLAAVERPAFAYQPAAGTVVVLEVKGVINPVVAQYVQRGIAAAESAEAELVVIRLDTPGGLDSAMREIIQTILNAEVPVAVYVAPAGARAASAGVFITMAAHAAAMAPGTNIGAAHPVGMGEELPETVADKAVNDAVAYIQAIAAERERNAEWAEEAVRTSASLTARQALEQNVIDLVVDNLEDLLAALDGRTLALAHGEATLDLAGAEIEAFPMTWMEVILHGIVDPNIALILLSLGTIGLIAEFYNPGAVFPGVSGAVALILAFVALGSLPVNWGGIALIVLAFILLILDLQVTGFALSVAGAVCFALGALLLFSPFTPTAPAMPHVSVNPWLVAGMTGLLVAFFGLALSAGLRAQRSGSLMETSALIGAVGTAVSDLDPRGVVQIQSETWTAETVDEPVRAGQKVEVVEARGLYLRVRRKE